VSDGGWFGEHRDLPGYLERVLLPTLPTAKLIIVDNYAVHQSYKVRRLIKAHGCYLSYLPPYSPDFNPIEMAFSKLKAYLRKVAARTTEHLENAIVTALQIITPQDAKGWFSHCGYL
jgi:transposase